MKSRKKIILILACVIVAALGSLVLSSCSLNRLSIDDLVEMGYDYTVKFDMQGGKANSNDYLYVQVAAGSLLPEPGTVGSTGAVVYPAPTRTGYTLTGYYRGVEDEEGNVTLGDKWDFSTDTVEDNLTLYAGWMENYKLIVYYGEDLSLTTEVSLTITDGVFSKVSSVKHSGYTALGYYLDEDFTEEITFPYTPTLEQFAEGESTLNVYAKTLTGTYTLVDDSSDLVTIYEGSNIYLLNDIDMEGVTVSFPDSYGGKFEGNGYTISNLTITRSVGTSSDGDFGMFKKVLATASFTDITFENLTVNLTLDNTRVQLYRAGLFAGYIYSGATLSNVTVTGTLNISYTTAVMENIEYGTLCGEINSGAILENCVYEDITVNYVNSDEQTSE